jgi:peroxiredoxin
MRNVNYKKLTLVLIVALVLALAFLGLNRNFLIQEMSFKSFPKIDFTLADIKGNPYLLSQESSGRSLLLFFWALDCPACKPDLGFLQEIKNNPQYSQLNIVSISIGSSANEIQRFLSTMEERPDLPILVDESREVAGKYDVYKVPETYLINKQGSVFKKYIGPISEQREGLLYQLGILVKK